MKKKAFIATAIVITIILLYISFSGEESEEIYATVTKGDFEISVSTNGELAAKSSVNILGPAGGMRRLNLWNVKISDLVPEGTKVDSGDHVATLDRSDILVQMKNIDLEIQKNESQYTQTRLDTTLNLRGARSSLISLVYDFNDAQIRLEQSKFEPPATIKKIENEIEQKKFKLEEEKKNYKIKQDQYTAKMREVEAGLTQTNNQKALIMDVLSGFDIVAPANGIVIYKKDYEGNKISTGSSISPWGPEVAELPDLTTLTSITYVNEVDIRKVKLDLPVDISIDAFPDKSIKGKVTKVANVGEQRPNSETKVFQVIIELTNSDKDLLPGMSTGNKIIADLKKDALFIPIECVLMEDSTSYVYKKAGLTSSRQDIKTGLINDNYVEVLEGLVEGDEVLLSIEAKVTAEK